VSHVPNQIFSKSLEQLFITITVPEVLSSKKLQENISNRYLKYVNAILFSSQKTLEKSINSKDNEAFTSVRVSE
jgi:hypothetical protein